MNATAKDFSQEISARAMFYVEPHFLSQTIEVTDALIGATAVDLGSPVLTANDKHYEVEPSRIHPMFVISYWLVITGGSLS